MTTTAAFAVSPSLAWYGQAAIALAVVFLLGIALALEWDAISPAWRRVLIASTAEQVVIAYGSIEARSSDVELGLRVLLLTLSLIGLVMALTLLLLERRVRPVSYYPQTNKATR